MASDEEKQSRAEAKAAVAKAKALRPWYKKKRAIIPAVVVGLFLLIALGGDENASETANVSSSEESSEDQPKTAGIGEAVRDGRFEFTVKGIECGKMTVGGEFVSEQAQGQFCLLDVSVKNVGDEAQYLDASNQYLYDQEDREFSADSLATTYANPETTAFFLEEINPGNSVSGKIVFDVSKDTEIVRVVLNDSLFSSGVEVGLQ